ncbi:cytochrome P450 [Auricularia subglabra TFB-10046 SS5]|nr:cytochrome P450 [Auricularia subglabra TFB-10046 SS5]
MAERLLRDGLEGRALSHDMIADTTAIVYIGGADTTRTAQQEIDRVLGTDCLPELADRESLPYVTGILLEVMRLFPVLPLGIGRRMMADDEYDGMRIPKGATIVPNVWAILRDARLYANPEQLLPERYIKNGVLDLKDTAPDPRGPLFGFGRRRCPGRHFADASAWLAIATVLACFDITPAKDENGNDIAPQTELRTGAVTCVREFPCEIRPRSEETRRMLAEAAEHPIAPLRISTTSSAAVSASAAGAMLQHFVAEYDSRTQGESAVGAQLRKVCAALQAEAGGKK